MIDAPLWLQWHVDHWIDHGLTSPTVRVLGRNMLAPRCVTSLPPVQGPWWRGCWRQPCAGTMARRPVCRSTAGWLTLMPSLRPRSSDRGWAGFSCGSLRPLTFHDVDKQSTQGTWRVVWVWAWGRADGGLQLGHCEPRCWHECLFNPVPARPITGKEDSFAGPEVLR